MLGCREDPTPSSLNVSVSHMMLAKDEGYVNLALIGQPVGDCGQANDHVAEQGGTSSRLGDYADKLSSGLGAYSGLAWRCVPVTDRHEFERR
ncbi:unnamed protein product [Protopolystoma xenopodis]|uniref:Uncharacterized protein n=1 Tax=Protopolystoma xenopodis TaxID=117903 RepID=A0A448WWA4_9PLAT|nr:unnamed protein product [Protopolystoma xenopodis]